MHGTIQLLGLAGERMAAGQGNAVGQFTVVQDRAATRLPADDGATAAGCVSLAIGVILEVAE